MATTATCIGLRCDKDNYEERAANDGNIKPGHLLEILSTNKVQKHSVVGGRTMRWVALEDGKQGYSKNQYDAYASGDPVRIQACEPGDWMALRLPAAAAAVVIGSFLISDGAGCVIKSAQIGALLLYNAVAASTAVSNTVSTEQFYDVTYTLPAATLRVGDVINIKGHVVVSAAASTDTITVKLYIGAIVVAVTAAVDSVTADVAYFDADVVVRTIGASGTIVCRQINANGPIATGTVKAGHTASSSLDTTVANIIRVSSTWSATSATCTSALQSLTVELKRYATADHGVAIAIEAIDNSAGSSEALVQAIML